MIVVAVAVLVGVFFAATGRGGELSREPPDYAPLDLGPVSAGDVALLRPPTALWGYNVPVTDEALERIARAMRERDLTIAYLQRQLADLTAQTTPLTAAIPGPHLPQRIRPVDPDDPASPAAPAAPAAPVAPVGPAAPVAPAAPVGPVAPDSPAGQDDPAGPATAPAAEEQN
jgi:hypothetical protein